MLTDIISKAKQLKLKKRGKVIHSGVIGLNMTSEQIQAATCISVTMSVIGTVKMMIAAAETEIDHNANLGHLSPSLINRR